MLVHADREHHKPTSTPSEITFPGITLAGTSPTFYKINITEELNEAVKNGRFPINSVTTYYHTPRLPHDESEGMKCLQNRKTIIRHYQAFKPSFFLTTS